jgi:hypothetical protein
VDEIVAFTKKWLSITKCSRIGEIVAEVQRGAMLSLAEAAEGGAGQLSLRGVYRDQLDPSSGNETVQIA